MAERARAVVTIGGMSCAACVARLEKALSKLPGVLKVSVNLASGQAHIVYHPGVVGPPGFSTSHRSRRLFLSGSYRGGS